MSLATNITDLATAIATKVKETRTWVNGNASDLSGLQTTAKTNLVAAINEVADAVAGSSGINDGVTGTTTTWSSSKIDTEISDAVAGVTVDLTDLIDDTAPATDSVYSSTKTDAQIATAVADLIDSAPGDLDTLAELAAGLNDNESAVATINTALGNRVRFDASQTLTSPQQVQARTNIGAADASALSTLTTNVGTTTTDFVATFEAGVA